MPDTKHTEASSADDDIDSWMRDLARAPRMLPPGETAEGAASRVSRMGQRTTQESGDPAERLPEAGAVLDGRYRLDGVLGAGGMGVVYTATQLSTGKQVAIKWMRARERSSEEQAKAAERFVREAKAAARIEHPNVVDVYDVCGDPLTPYLVMERLRGENLRTRLEREPLSWAEAVRLLAPVMQALSRAHAVGVVHRDLKPDNLFLAEHPGGETVLKVLDFGISRLASRGDDVELSLTRTGAMIGTPVYMPLEQLRGQSDLDGRTDVYSLGVVLFEALTGQRPHQARNAAEYGALVASTPPTPLSTLRPDLRGPREEVVMRALAREREDRFESMDAFRQALLAAPSESRASSTWRRLPLAALGLGGLLLAGAALWRFESTPPPRTLSPEPQAALPPAVLAPPPAVQAPAPPPVVMPAAAAPSSQVAELAPPPEHRSAALPTPAKRVRPRGKKESAAPSGAPAPTPVVAPAPAQPSSEDPALMKSDEF